MSFKFKVNINGDVNCIVNKVKNAIQKEGGIFSGDANSGNISIGTPMGKVKGNYKTNGQECVIEITDKPFLVPQSTLESKIKEAFANA